MQVIEELIETWRGVRRMSAVGPFNPKNISSANKLRSVCGVDATLIPASD
jgi:hypothetical protein